MSECIMHAAWLAARHSAVPMRAQPRLPYAPLLALLVLLVVLGLAKHCVKHAGWGEF